MKTKYLYILIAFACTSLYTSCTLDKHPLSEYSEINFGSDEKEDSIKYTTKGEIYSQYQKLYQLMKERQEHWYLDMLLIADARADNAYGGTTGAEVVPLENNAVDAGNSVLARDWDRYLADVAQANDVICNIDDVPDPTLTAAEKKQWKAEAKIFRAMVWFDMVRIWGNIPIVTEQPVDITSENIEEVFPLYYPKQKTVTEAYEAIIKDLTEALTDAPDNDPSDKTKFTKAVANSLLAKAYAEKPLRDYSKVLTYCDAVIANGFDLNSNYGDMFELNDAGTDAKMRSTRESILEVNYVTGGGSWVTWMFGRDLLNYETQFSWPKWITPSRDLIRAYEAENDAVRMNQSVVYYECSWNNYYPAANYPFMYKCRSGVSSIIKIRFADILLLKAEALANLDGSANIQQAAELVNRIRTRAELDAIPASASASKESMLDAVLKERRLELAFEGQRLFDLIRYDKLASVMNNLNSKDEGRLHQSRTFTDNSALLPIPQAAMDININLEQNPGY